MLSRELCLSSDGAGLGRLGHIERGGGVLDRVIELARVEVEPSALTVGALEGGVERDRLLEQWNCLWRTRHLEEGIGEQLLGPLLIGLTPEGSDEKHDEREGGTVHAETYARFNRSSPHRLRRHEWREALENSRGGTSSGSRPLAPRRDGTRRCEVSLQSTRGRPSRSSPRRFAGVAQ